MSEKILLSLDGSKFAERALDIAIDFSLQRAATLTLLQVVGKESLSAKAEEYLQSCSETATSRGVECPIKVVVGDPAGSIVEEAKDYQLLVMTSHGHSQYDQLILGTVVEKVVRQAPCPVFIQKERQIRLRDLKRVMVPLDGFALSQTALPEAEKICRATGGTVVLARVDEAVGLEIGLLSREEQGRELEEYLNEMKNLVDSELTTETAHDFGSAARSLLRLTEQKNIDLVVMSSHGRGGFNRWVCGSVSENVLRASAGPVLIVRPKDEDR